MTIQKRIRSYIFSNGLKINYVAQRSSIDVKKFYRIINSEVKLTADDFERICNGLEVDPQIFFNHKFLEAKKKEALSQC